MIESIAVATAVLLLAHTVAGVYRRRDVGARFEGIERRLRLAENRRQRTAEPDPRTAARIEGLECDSERLDRACFSLASALRSAATGFSVKLGDQRPKEAPAVVYPSVDYGEIFGTGERRCDSE